MKGDMMNVDRRSFLKSLTIAAASCGIPRSIFAYDDAPPNIIYILADDAGYGDLSCYGQKKFKTPNIDRLAVEGMRFTQHYAGNTVCAPSRCCLLTGKHTGHAQIRGNKPAQPIGQHPLGAGTVTVGSILKEAGYATGAFGKWGLGPVESSGDPLKQGFDTFFGYICQRNAHSHYPGWMYHDRERIELDGTQYSQDLIMKHATDFVKANAKKKPFFCYLPVAIPHAAMQVPEEYHRPYREKFPQFEDVRGRYGRKVGGGKAIVENPVAAFPAMMQKLDDDIGSLMQLLKDLGIDDNTLVIFTSDNGPHLEGGHDPEFWDSNGPLRGFKRDLYEGGIREPMIARWPGKIKPGTVSDHISAFWDVMPTFAQIASVSCPADIDGISFLPTLLSAKGAQKQHDYLYWEFPVGKGAQAIRKGDWKAVRVGVSKDPDIPVELYNLAEDIGETTDVAAEHPDIVEEMKALFKSARIPSEVFPLYK